MGGGYMGQGRGKLVKTDQFRNHNGQCDKNIIYRVASARHT